MAGRHKRPARADIFKEGHRPTWIVVTDPWYKRLDVRALPAGSDLVREFLLELLRYHENGWHLSEFNSGSGYFFAAKEREPKRLVSIILDDPSEPAPKGLGHTSDFLKCQKR